MRERLNRGRSLLLIRLAAGVTRTEITDQFGIDSARICDFEFGRRPELYEDDLPKILRMLGVPETDLEYRTSVRAALGSVAKWGPGLRAFLIRKVQRKSQKQAPAMGHRALRQLEGGVFASNPRFVALERWLECPGAIIKGGDAFWRAAYA